MCLFKLSGLKLDGEAMFVTDPPCADSTTLHRGSIQGAIHTAKLLGKKFNRPQNLSLKQSQLTVCTQKKNDRKEKNHLQTKKTDANVHFAEM